MEHIVISLHKHAKELQETTELKILLKGAQRNDECVLELPGLMVDYSRQLVTAKTMELLNTLAKHTQVFEKMKAMANGERINTTENRAVLHMALRAGARLPASFSSQRIDTSDPSQDAYHFDGVNVVPMVHQVQKQVQEFTDNIRNGTYVGITGKPLTTVVCIGIGGSFLGAKFVYESLRCDHRNGAMQASAGRSLRFIANVDPIDMHKQTQDIDWETTLVIICSKTFTTAETMLNANTVRKALLTALHKAVQQQQQQQEEEGAAVSDRDIISKHFAACSTNIEACNTYGISTDRIFAFWDWVGGRYSVTSAVGLLPLALHFGWTQMQAFLAGARDMDAHFLTNTSVQSNLPVLLGMLGVWNSQYLDYRARALACYSEALCDFAAHVQQVDMESNGKRVTKDGQVYIDPYTKQPPRYGEIDFGQSGTNSQHSFFQLFHQGQVVPIDFIGHIHSQYDSTGNHPSKVISNHEELMCNFFAQPDALALGISLEELPANNPISVHKVMPGNRPSTVILFDQLSAYEVGMLLALYEHRTAVQGFVWNLNSFDQFGVELGKQLANTIRNVMTSTKADTSSLQASSSSSTAAANTTAITQSGLISSTQRILQRFLQQNAIVTYK